MEKKEYNSKKNWNKANLTKLTYQFPKPLVAEFKSKCLKEEVSQASIIRKAIESYLGKESL